MERYDKQRDSFLGTKGSGVQIFKYFPAGSHINMPPWRNWLARSAVNRKVGGSSPPGGAFLLNMKMTNCRKEKLFFVDLGRIRTCNLLIRSQTRYPLRHETKLILWCKGGNHIAIIFKGIGRETSNVYIGFLSVVVITCPSHGQGRRFDPGRKQCKSIFNSIPSTYLKGFPLTLKKSSMIAQDESHASSEVKQAPLCICSAVFKQQWKG